jgi:hypothetical protein
MWLAIRQRLPAEKVEANIERAEQEMTLEDH